MKTVKEKTLEQAFIRVMNRLISSRGASMRQDIYRVEEFTIGELKARIKELQSQMMVLVKRGFDDKVYLNLAKEIDMLRERMIGLKGEQTERALRKSWGKELQDYLAEQETEIRKFDEDLFRKVIDKIRVQSMVEVEFVFKAGVEVREILG